MNACLRISSPLFATVAGAFVFQFWATTSGAQNFPTQPVLLANLTQVPATLPELIALAKAKPGALNFASGGAGTSIHLAGELLIDAAGIDIRHVPYRGGAPAVTALIGGEVQLLFDATA